MTTEPVSAEQAPQHVAGQQLHVKGAGVDRLLKAGSIYQIGRDPKADVVISDARVSWHHAIVQRHPSGWQLEDASSTNGTFVDRQRIRQVAITGDCSVRLGHPDNGPLLRCTVIGAPAQQDGAPAQVHLATAAARVALAEPVKPAVSGGNRSPSAVLSMPSRKLRIGRATDNDVVVSDLSVSRHHAELRRTSRGTYEIVDLGSHNGTYLNGQRITVAAVSETDLVGVGPATFRRVGDELQE